MPRSRASAATPAQLRPVEHLARQPAHRALDGDRPDIGGHPAAGGTRQHRLDVGPGEGRGPGRERQQRESRQRLAGVAGVVVDVAGLRDDHPPPGAGQRAQRQLVGERSRGHEDGGLLAEQRRPLLLEPLDLRRREGTSPPRPRRARPALPEAPRRPAATGRRHRPTAAPCGLVSGPRARLRRPEPRPTSRRPPPVTRRIHAGTSAAYALRAPLHPVRGRELTLHQRPARWHGASSR